MHMKCFSSGIGVVVGTPAAPSGLRRAAYIALAMLLPAGVRCLWRHVTHKAEQPGAWCRLSDSCGLQNIVSVACAGAGRAAAAEPPQRAGGPAAGVRARRAAQ